MGMPIVFLNSDGVFGSEAKALKQIERAFRASWKGYASLELRDRLGSAEIDLLVITHERILLVELKDWNGHLSQTGDRWILNGQDRGRSPVSNMELKCKRLSSLLKARLGHKLNHRVPFVEAVVVLTGTARKDGLGDERAQVQHLDEFLSLAGKDEYLARYPERTVNYRGQQTPFYALNPEARPNKHLDLFDEFFNVANPAIRARTQKFHNYAIQGQPVFTHPKALYQEFEVVRADDKNYRALLRLWNLEPLKLDFPTSSDRAHVGLREHRVIGYLRERDEELASFCLSPLYAPTEEEVGLWFDELYELPRRHQRLGEFIHGEGSKLSSDERVALVKALLDSMARVHDQAVAHRDIGDHTLWFSKAGRIRLSGFVTGHLPEAKTIREHRDLLSAGHVGVPEDVLDDPGRDPFRADVFLLAVAAHTLVYRRLPGRNADLKDIYEWRPIANDAFGGRLDSWFHANLSYDPSDRASNARQMLDAFNAVVGPTNADQFDAGMLQVYSTGFVPMGDYPMSAGGTPTAYRSTGSNGDVWVKVRFSVAPDRLSHAERIGLLSLLDRASKVRSLAAGIAPTVLKFGLSEPMQALFVVQEWLEGVTLLELDIRTRPQATKVAVARSLIRIVATLHDKGLDHGDLKPENVIVVALESDAPRVALLDLIDTQSLTERAFNTAYSPPRSVSPRARDNFAVCKIVVDLLGGETDADATALASRAAELLTLDEILSTDVLQSLDSASQESGAAEDEHRICSRDLPTGPFPGDNGRYHLRSQRRDDGRVELTITATTAQLVLRVRDDSGKPQLTSAFIKGISHAKFAWEVRNAQSVVTGRLSTATAVRADAETFLEAVWEGLVGGSQNAEVDDGPTSTISDGCASPPDDVANDQRGILLRDLWEALIENEMNLWPEVQLLEDAVEPRRDKRGGASGSDVEARYAALGSPLEYAHDDRVAVYEKTESGVEQKALGQLEVSSSDANRLTIRLRWPKRLVAGTRLVFQSAQDQQSYDRRRRAVRRILDGKANIPGLLGVMSGGPEVLPTKCAIVPTNEQLDHYTVLEDGHTTFTLNLEQREAFRTLCGNGPISLLQGPPGTGKTAFIGAFVHFLVTEGGVRNVLLAGQSHHAVNNAAEQVRLICERSNTSIDLVRLGPENMVSDELLDVHSDGIQDRARSLFRAEFVDRVLTLSRDLGLPTEYVTERARGYWTLLPLLMEIESLGDPSDTEPDDEAARQDRLKRREERLAAILKKEYGGTPSEARSRDDVLAGVDAFLAQKHGVFSDQGRRRLGMVLELAKEWLNVLKVGRNRFEHFLARTRSIVCGTCVGLGRREYAIGDTVFDWVIIDEAARCDPGELAVAMQAGRRVLLVGDHKQLPPQLDRELVRLVATQLRIPEETVRQSEFQRVFESPYGKVAGVTLRTQYRMTVAISDLISHCFYPQTPLETGRGESPAYFATLPTTLKAEVVWFDTSAAKNSVERKVGTSYDNEAEAQTIIRLLERLTALDDFYAELVNEDAPIGVICTYEAQKQRVLRLLAEAPWAGDLRSRKLVKVDTVDAYQGKQNRLVLLSLTRNNGRGEQGFVNSEQRINVSLSRAMDRLFVVGARSMWRGQNEGSPMGRVAAYVQARAGEGGRFAIVDSEGAV